MENENDNDLALIVGAKAIADALEIKVKQFYNARNAGGLTFVWREPGLGLVTSRSAVKEYNRARATGQKPAETAAPKALDNAA